MESKFKKGDKVKSLATEKEYYVEEVHINPIAFTMPKIYLENGENPERLYCWEDELELVKVAIDLKGVITELNPVKEVSVKQLTLEELREQFEKELGEHFEEEFSLDNLRKDRDTGFYINRTTRISWGAYIICAKANKILKCDE